MVELIIRLDDAGQLQVGGPIHDKVLAYGLLAAAADEIRAYHGPAARRVQIAADVPASALRIMKD